MLAAYLATGDGDYLDLVRRGADYLQCYETTAVDWEDTAAACDRFHFQATFLRNLGHYLELRTRLGLGDDAPARALLERRMDYMTGVLWDGASGEFRMCYLCDEPPPALCPFHDNWLLAVADAFAVGGRVLGRLDLVSDYARPVFLDGSANQFYLGSPISYHSAKEYVNQVGFGGMFLDAHLALAGLLFADGFESGAVSAWSSSVP